MKLNPLYFLALSHFKEVIKIDIRKYLSILKKKKLDIIL